MLTVCLCTGSALEDTRDKLSQSADTRVIRKKLSKACTEFEKACSNNFNQLSTCSYNCHALLLLLGSCVCAQTTKHADIFDRGDFTSNEHCDPVEVQCLSLAGVVAQCILGLLSQESRLRASEERLKARLQSELFALECELAQTTQDLQESNQVTESCHIVSAILSHDSEDQHECEEGECGEAHELKPASPATAQLNEVAMLQMELLAAHADAGTVALIVMASNDVSELSVCCAEAAKTAHDDEITMLNFELEQLRNELKKTAELIVKLKHVAQPKHCRSALEQLTADADAEAAQNAHDEIAMLNFELELQRTRDDGREAGARGYTVTSQPKVLSSLAEALDILERSGVSTARSTL